MPRCRGCGAPIEFIRTEAGKSIPVDAGPWMEVDEGALGEGRRTIVTSDGRVVSGVLISTNTRPQDPEHGHAVGRQSHFATCPEADRFRREGGTDR